MSPTRPPRTATGRATRAAGAGLALALVLVTTAACGSGDTTSAASSSSSSSTPAPASTSPAAGTSSTSADASPSTSATSAAAAAPAAAAKMTIKDYMFEVPASVKAGATVTVTNMDTAAHTVTSKQGGFDVKVNPRGATATFTAPSKPGKYPIDCDFHAQMNAVLVVS